MEIGLFIIIVLLVVILYMQSEKFARLNSEIKSIKRKLDFLLEKNLSSSLSDKEKVTTTQAVVKEVTAHADVPVKSQVAQEKLKSEYSSRGPVIPDNVSGKVLVSEEVVSVELPEEMSNATNISLKETIIETVKEEKSESSVSVNRVAKKVNYEKFIGENLFGKIGILVLVVGIGLFVKYAIDKNWINETMRTVLGFVAGSILLFIAERVREKYRTFSSLLAGGAFAVFYLTVAIAFHYYHLFSQTVAFVILVFITFMMSVLSILYDRRELAVISLVGGFIAPFLVSSAAGSYLVLFTYLIILNLGMFGLSLYKKWAILPILSFFGTYLIFLSYVLFNLVFDTVSEPVKVAQNLLVYATLFYFIFILPILTILKYEGKKLNKFLLSLIIANNFIFLLLGTLFLDLMHLPFKSTGLFTLFIAFVNLVLVIWLRKSKQDYKFLIYTMLGLVLTFVSITIPIQLEGNYITLFWASEMVLLLWLYVKSGIRVYEYASLILIVLTLISYGMDLKYQIYSPVTGTIFMNSMFATSMFTGLAAGIYAYLIARYRGSFENARFLGYTYWNVGMLIASVIILYYTFMTEFYHYLTPDLAYEVMHLFTSSCILIFCYSFRKRFPVTSYNLLYSLAIGLNVFLYVVCIWQNSNNSLGAVFLLLPWITTLIVTASLCYVSKLYIVNNIITNRFTVYLSVIATLFWLAIVRLFLQQAGLPDEFNAGFSISLAIAGFVQMSLGMRLHLKALRLVSLVTLGLVLAKLVIVDLWAMPTVGKIIVFIILGIILLVLSFLYQKLKDVLFKDDNESVN